MDDTVAMQDSERALEQLGGPATVDMASNPEQLAAALKVLSSSSQPSTPQQVGREASQGRRGGASEQQQQQRHCWRQ